MLFSQVFNAKVPVNLVKLKTGTHRMSNDVIVGQEKRDQIILGFLIGEKWVWDWDVGCFFMTCF